MVAALRNALRVVGKTLTSARIVLRDAGPPAMATARLLEAVGVACPAGWHDDASVTETTRRRRIQAADVLITTSRDPDLDQFVDEMAADPIVFLLDDGAKPNTITAISHRVAVLATRSPDHANWLDWGLAYPGVLRGLLDRRSSELTTEMQLRAALLLSQRVGVLLSHKILLPSADDPAVVADLRSAIGSAARGETGEHHTASLVR